jgi:hypothetical protein
MYDRDDVEKLKSNSKFLNSSSEELHDCMGIIDRTMRGATPEESKSVHDYVESVSKPTGVNFDEVMDDSIKFVGILGEPYKIIRGTPVEYPRLEKLAGYCDLSNKLIIIGPPTNCDTVKAQDFMTNQTIRHEIIHAYLYESGLDVESWGCNEEIVDWIAIQAPKMFKIFTEIGVL